jgi:hypothetical protein
LNSQYSFKTLTVAFGYSDDHEQAEAASYIQLRDRSDEIEQLWTRFEQQASTLRNLLQAGAQESTRFYGRLGNYNAFVFR